MDSKERAAQLLPHCNPMLSMQDLFSREEIKRFVDDCLEKLGSEITFLVETKIDDKHISADYIFNLLTRLRKQRKKPLCNFV